MRPGSPGGARRILRNTKSSLVSLLIVSQFRGGGEGTVIVKWKDGIASSDRRVSEEPEGVLMSSFYSNNS